MVLRLIKYLFIIFFLNAVLEVYGASDEMLLEEYNISIPSNKVEIEKIYDDVGGLTNDGIRIYYFTFREKPLFEGDGWVSFPLPDTVTHVLAQEIDTAMEGLTVEGMNNPLDINNGLFKVISDYPVEHAEFDIFIYDEDNNVGYSIDAFLPHLRVH